MDGVSSVSALPLRDLAAVPIVDAERCTGCGRCVEACPTGAVSLVAPASPPAAPPAAGLAVVDPTRCTYCTDCEASCPERAIDCPFEIVAFATG